MRCLLLFALVLPLPSAAQKLHIYPAAPIAPRGSYQSVTAIVTGVNDKTVTWTSDGGTIVGTNPCVVNEPCTVALTATNPGTYHLTATSNADKPVNATSTITLTDSPTPATTHPRLVITAAMVPGLRAKATASNPMYSSIQARANRALATDSAIWSWSCQSGTGQPSSSQIAHYKEQDAYLFAFMSLVDPSPSNRAAWGCYGRDIMVYMMNAVLNNEKAPMDGVYGLTGNRGSDSTLPFTVTPDWLMAGGYLSGGDITLTRAYFAWVGKNMVTVPYTGVRAPIGKYNSSAQFLTGNIYDYTGQRAMGNNYTHSKEMYLVAVALTFNDDVSDDPSIPNTCNATRHVVCPDGTAGSLHAYWTYLAGGMLYKDWAHIEDPSLSWQAYQATYKNLPARPTCNSTWGPNPVPCFGEGRGGESVEGGWYQYSLYRTRYALNAIHTAGYDDPILYGPQLSYGTSSWWDLHYVSQLSALTGTYGAPPRWAYWGTGDQIAYYRTPSDFQELASTMTYDIYTGRTDRTHALEWAILNVAFGGPSDLIAELANDNASSVAVDLFLSLPAADPTATPPSDPRPSLPTDIFNAGNQHILARSGWTPADTAFSYYCPNAVIDHEHEFCGRFDIFSKGEYITKGRTEFNDYNDAMSSVPQSNLAGYQATGTCVDFSACYMYPEFSGGGQFSHGFQAGEVTLRHNESSAYVAAIVDTTNLYNGSTTAGLPPFTGVKSASRSLIYLRDSNQVVYYDRGVTTTPQAHKLWQVVTGPLTINGNTGSWHTRSGKQRAYFTSLLPSTATVADAGPYKGEVYSQNSDWEPYTRILVNAGTPTTTQFLSVMEWGSSTLSKSLTSLVRAKAGQDFDGCLIGSSLVMFMRNWPSTFTSVTYPASGATKQYISDLTPNTGYSIKGEGTPSSAATDSAGVLTFSAAGSGDITIEGVVKPSTLLKTKQGAEGQTMKIIFWASLGGVVYTYLGYPVIMWMFARLRPRQWRASPITPSVSIVLAVHNGVLLLAGKIQHLLDLDYPNIKQIIVVSDGSSDGTGELLDRLQHPNITTIILKEQGGKAVAVNAGVAQATADVVLFVDIRPEIASGAIQQLVGNFADETVGCVSGNLKLRDDGHDATSSAVGGIYWRYEQWIRTCEATSDSPVGVYGGFYAIRRKLFVPQPAGIILDDMFQPLAIIRQGFRSVVDPLAFVYDTWPKKSEAEFDRKVRTLAGNFQLFLLAPWTLTTRNRLLFQLVSHKVMRLLVPYLLILQLVSSILLSAKSPIYAAIAAVQVFGWSIAVVGLRFTIPVLRLISAPASALLVLNAAAVVGLYKFLFTRGPLWKIWNSGKTQDSNAVTV